MLLLRRDKGYPDPLPKDPRMCLGLIPGHAEMYLEATDVYGRLVMVAEGVV